jgi:hypothetical protein
MNPLVKHVLQLNFHMISIQHPFFKHLVTSRKQGFCSEVLPPLVSVVFEPGTNDPFTPGLRGYRSKNILVPVQT